MDTSHSDRSVRYLLTGGGTAGHVYPALAFAEHIAKEDPKARFLYVGTRNGAEERIVPAWGYPLKTLKVRGMPMGRAPLKLLAFLVLLLFSTVKALGIMRRFRPHVIIATGGYASAPVFLAALLLRLLRRWQGVLALHEQNIIPGRFNQLMSRWADFVGTSFPGHPEVLSRREKLLDRIPGSQGRCRHCRGQCHEGDAGTPGPGHCAARQGHPGFRGQFRSEECQ